jgi:DNA-binding GntR family transcriptional regulator
MFVDPFYVFFNEMFEHLPSCGRGDRMPNEPSVLSKDAQALLFIRSAILSGRYPPQARITASQVASEAGISIGPIREAMRRLEAEGLISYQANVGATVIGMDYQVLSETLATLAILEGAATALSAPFLTEVDFELLESINKAMAQADDAGDLAEVSRQNRRFHAACYGQCPNAWLLDLLRMTADRAYVGRRSLFFDAQRRSHQSVQEHQEIVRLIRSNAPNAAIEAAVRRHKQPTIEFVQAKARQRAEPSPDR